MTTYNAMKEILLNWFFKYIQNGILDVSLLGNLLTVRRTFLFLHYCSSYYS